MGLFTWVRNLFGGSEERYDLYKPKERLIFHFWDGKKMVAADPMALYKRLSLKGADIDVVQKIITNPYVKPEDQVKAHDDLVRYIRDIFALEKPEGIDCTGLLGDVECVDLLDTFYTFIGAQKKNTSPTPTPATATSATTPTSSAAAPPTTSSSASGCADSVPSTASPPPSNEQSKSPSVSSTPECPTTET